MARSKQSDSLGAGRAAPAVPPDPDACNPLTYRVSLLDEPTYFEEIHAAARAEFRPATPWEDLLVEEVAELTARLRVLAHQRDMVMRTRVHEILVEELSILHRLGRLEGTAQDPRALVHDHAFGSVTAQVRAKPVLEALGVSIRGVRARAIAASVPDLGALDRQIVMVERQRRRILDDLAAKRQARRRAEVPDAEEVRQ